MDDIHSRSFLYSFAVYISSVVVLFVTFMSFWFYPCRFFTLSLFYSWLMMCETLFRNVCYSIRLTIRKDKNAKSMLYSFVCQTMYVCCVTVKVARSIFLMVVCFRVSMPVIASQVISYIRNWLWNSNKMHNFDHGNIYLWKCSSLFPTPLWSLTSKWN